MLVTSAVEPNAFMEDDISRIVLEYIPAQTLLVLRGVNCRLNQLVNDETTHRLNSDSADNQTDLNCFIKAMHGAFAFKKSCRNLKTVLVGYALV